MPKHCKHDRGTYLATKDGDWLCIICNKAMHGGPSRYKTKYRCPHRGQCHYCARPATSWDHIVPKSKGGPGSKDNLVESCQPCNRLKADSLPTCLCPKCRNAVRNYLDRSKSD